MWSTALLQVLAGTFASMAVGFVWFSPGVFGRLWWKYQFPGKKFGETMSGMSPIYTTFVAMMVQNSLLVVVINSVMEYSRHVSHPFPSLIFPAALGGIVSAFVACASYPHYAYSMKPFALYCICAGFDTVQLYSCVFLIYLLSWRSLLLNRIAVHWYSIIIHHHYWHTIMPRVLDASWVSYLVYIGCPPILTYLVLGALLSWSS